MEAIQEIQSHAQRIAEGKERVSPGQPAVLNEAAEIGEGVWQGDLGIAIVAKVPKDYVRVTRPTVADKQLVPGSTQGAKHVLKSLRGVQLWRPKDWPNPENLSGPCLVVGEAGAVIEHPVHGAVTIAPGHTVQCRYQREWDQEQRRERRNAD